MEEEENSIVEGGEGGVGVSVKREGVKKLAKFGRHARGGSTSVGASFAPTTPKNSNTTPKTKGEGEMANGVWHMK